MFAGTVGRGWRDSCGVNGVADAPRQRHAKPVGGLAGAFFECPTAQFWRRAAVPRGGAFDYGKRCGLRWKLLPSGPAREQVGGGC